MNLARYAGRTGELPKTVELPWDYFERRGILLDCRGPLVISGQSHWGFRVVVYTESHDMHEGPACEATGWQVGPTVPYGVTVEAGAWIGSESVLAGCHIGAGAVVAAGTVVRGQDVEPGVMVAGNPARVIAVWRETHGQWKWVYLPEMVSGYERRLE